MKSVMLYFGSFNPIHKGHITIAEWILDKGYCDEVWFVVSPQNPLKEEGTLISERHRLAMVELTISQSPYRERLHGCDIEFGMPKPSYTIDTLSALGRMYPAADFSILVGSDIVEQIRQWKEWEKLLNDYKIYVYPRRCYRHDDMNGKFTMLEGAPYEDYSSTQVRCALQESGDSEMIPAIVREYIEKHDLWRTKTI